MPKEDEKPIEEVPKKEEIQKKPIEENSKENIGKENLVKSSQIEIAKLPKTGNDYFFIKLLFSNFTIAIIITILIRKKTDWNRNCC